MNYKNDLTIKGPAAMGGHGRSQWSKQLEPGGPLAHWLLRLGGHGGCGWDKMQFKYKNDTQFAELPAFETYGQMPMSHMSAYTCPMDCPIDLLFIKCWHALCWCGLHITMQGKY